MKGHDSSDNIPIIIENNKENITDEQKPKFLLIVLDQLVVTKIMKSHS